MITAKATGGFVEYRGHCLRATPPSDGIPMLTARQRYGISVQKQWDLIDQGKLLAGLGKAASGNRCVKVSRSGVKRHAAAPSRGLVDLVNEIAPPDDGVPVNLIAEEIGRKGDTIRTWCGWDPHPALGRQLHYGIGPCTIPRQNQTLKRWNGLLVSRRDVMKIDDLIRNPYNRPIPGNPGRWTEEGVFVHNDGRRFLTERRARGCPDFKLTENALFLPIYFKRFREGEVLKVVFPGAIGCSADPWRVTVFAEEGIIRLVERRAGRVDGGAWRVPGEEWDDTEGRWYSTAYLVRSLTGILGRQIDRHQVHGDYRETGLLTRFKPVPVAHTKPGGRSGPTIVHHQSEVDDLLRDARAAAERAAIHRSQGSGVAQVPRHLVEVDETNKRFVRVDGDPIAVSYQMWKLLNLLATRRERNEITDLPALRGEDSSPLKTLKRFTDRCPKGLEVILPPGKKGNGGYRLL